MKKAALFIAAVLLLSMTGCKKSNNSPEEVKVGELNTEENTIKVSNNTETVQHKINTAVLPQEISRITDIQMTNSGKIILTAVDSEGKIMFYNSNSDMSVLTKIEFNSDYNINDMDRNFCYTYMDDGTIYLLETVVTHNGIEFPSEDDAEFDYEEYLAASQAEYSLCRYNTKGKRDEKHIIKNASDYLQMESGAGIQNMLFVGEKILFLSGGRIYSMTMEGEIEAEINISEDENVTQLLNDSDGNVCCVVSNPEKSYICTVNTENMTLNGDMLVIPDEISGKLLKGNGAYRFFAESKSKFYGITKENTSEVLVDFVKSGLSVVYQGMINVGENFMAVEQGKLLLLTENDSEDNADTVTIKVGCLAQMIELEELAAKFNRSSSKYQIEIDSYGKNLESGNIPDEDFEKLKLDIISGKAPDILICSNAELMQNLALKGAFADLYELMESDTEINTDTLMPNIVESYDMDGSLYILPTKFSIETCVAKSKFTDIQNWTLDDMKKLYNQHKDEKDLFLSANNKIAVFLFASSFGEAFIDRKNNTCNFNSDEFKQLIEFCNEFPDVEEALELKKAPEGMPDMLVCARDYALLDLLYMDTLRDYANMKYLYYGGEELTFVGSPTNDGKGANLLGIREIAILNSCEDKKAAWNVFKTFFEADYQIYSDGMSPVTTYFEKAADLTMMNPGYFTDDGSYNTYTDKTYVDGIGDIIINPLTKEERDRLCEYVKGISKRRFESSSSYNIIREEVKACLYGNISVDEAAENIQQRMTIYLSENS